MAINCLRELELLSPDWTFDATYTHAVPPPREANIPLTNVLSGTKCDKLITQAAMTAMTGVDTITNIHSNLSVAKLPSDLYTNREIKPPNEDEI